MVGQGGVTLSYPWRRGVKDENSDVNMYGRTKAFNLMTSSELNRRLAASGVVCLARAPAARCRHRMLSEALTVDCICSAAWQHSVCRPASASIHAEPCAPAAPEQWQSQQRIESCNKKKRRSQYVSAAFEAVLTRAARRSRAATRASRAQTSTTKWTRLASSLPRRAAQPLMAGMSMLTGKCSEVTALRRAASRVRREQDAGARLLMSACAAPGDGGREHAGGPV